MLTREAELLVRMARPEDLEAIRDLQLMSLKVLTAKDYDAVQVDALLASKAELRGWDEHHFVAEVHGLIVGFGALARWRPWVNALFVHPEFTRQGIATRLLGAMEEEALRRRDRVLWVLSSLTGGPFYRALGFEVVRDEVISVDGGGSVQIPCLRMRKSLIGIGAEVELKEGYVENTFGATLQNIAWMFGGALGMIVLGQVLKLFFDL